MQDRARFKIPVSFPNLSCLNTDQRSRPNGPTLLDSTFITSSPTIVEYWQNAESVDGDSGVIVGCTLGTIYVLSLLPGLSSTTAVDKEGPELANSKSSKRKSRISLGLASPYAALSPTLNMAHKTRVVSGVTAEQVEAPKNYVDFDDEPEKLKDILKGRIPRDKSATNTADSNTDKASKSNSPSFIEPIPFSKRKHFFSVANSGSSTPPFSTPSSPREFTFDDNIWALKYHIIPSCSVLACAVKSIQLLPDANHFAVLLESGDIYIYSLDDGSCRASYQCNTDTQIHVSNKSERWRPSDIWSWCHLTVFGFGEYSFLTVTAASGDQFQPFAPLPEPEPSETSMCLLLGLTSNSFGLRLKRLGGWEINGPAVAYGLYNKIDGSLGLVTNSSDGHLVVQDINLEITTAETNGNDIKGHPFIPSAIKSLISGSSGHASNGKERRDHTEGPVATLSGSRNACLLLQDSRPLGMTMRRTNDDSIWGITWFHDSITVFNIENESPNVVLRHPAPSVRSVAWIDHNLLSLCCKDRVEVYQTKQTNINGSESENSTFQLELIRSLSIDFQDLIKVTPDSIIILRWSKKNKRQEIVSYPIPKTNDSPDVYNVIWGFDNSDRSLYATSLLPMDAETFVVGYSDGCIRECSLLELGRKALKSSSSKKSSYTPLNCGIVGLHIAHNPRTREKYLVGGGNDGSIIFWSLNTFGLLARWITFITPLSKIVQPDVDKSNPLYGCALCVSSDGTIAVIAIEGFYFLYLVPGYISPLIRICLSSKNLLLIYADRRARLWDSQTREFWRSMDQDKAEELIKEDGWSISILYNHSVSRKTVWSSVSGSYIGYDAAASPVLHLEQLVIDSISLTKTISTNKDEVLGILKALDRLKIVLSFFITPGLSSDIDSICYGKLGVNPSTAVAGLTSNGATTFYALSRSVDVWCTSKASTAIRALAIIATLRAMSLFEELTAAANTVISFYAGGLAENVGPNFKRPSLEVLGTRWFQASNELRPAIRTLFDATIASLSDDAAVKTTEKWQHHVPALQPDEEKESPTSSLALLICGCIAAEKYSLLSVSALADVSKSVGFYLHDENSIYRLLAIDLCSRGFHVWQHYVDAMEILRSLFNIATNSRKNSISIQNLAAQARMAVLSIASNDMPFLMGTLCLDVLNPPTTEHRRSVLQVLAFLIKKRPFLLQPHIPRLMEAVVKSLDPNSTGNRETVLDAATEIISYVVKTYPTVTFHTNTQRLAVGTNEGAVVMYDLKIAIRLYVLEGHKKPLAACSFSPDGRRLVTLCLSESNVLVWKVGSSFASFFTPGAPPRQGATGSEAFKTLRFHIGSDIEMTTEQTLDLIRIEWTSDRSVKVRIRQNVLTFST